MSYQTPIFESGLFGKANRFVCNGWTQSAQAVAANAQGLEWAQQQVVQGSVPERWLAKLTAATLISVDRWVYAFEPFAINSNNQPIILNEASTWGKGTGAINLRELRNDGTQIDGSPKPDGSSIGPVGSVYASGAWTTSSLAGYVEIHLDYNTSGDVLFWFSEPNPVRCS
jgi:hypothetical protein